MEDLNKWRKKGLCFKCNEQFSPEHVCKKLFLIQANLEDNDEDVEMEDDGFSEDEVSKISLHAMAGIQTPNTTRVNVRLGRQPIMAVIDSGSTHNFANE